MTKQVTNRTVVAVARENGNWYENAAEDSKID